MILNPKETLARDLFFQTGKTQKEIASIIGVSEKTIYLWMRDGDWKRLRSASKRMPSMIVENFYSQVQELNEEIRNRGAGKRYPTIQEAEVFRKMVMTIGRIQKGHTQPEYMEMMQKFLSWLMSQDHTLSKTLTPLANNFLKTQSVDGFLPFDIEYEPAPPKDEPNTIDFHDASLRATTPPLFLGEVPEGGRAQLAPDTPDDNNNTSLSFGEGWGEAKQDDNSTSLSIEEDEPDPKPEKTRNETITSYDNTHAPSGESPLEKPEMKNESEIGNEDANNTSLSFGEGRGEANQNALHNTSSPSERPGEVDLKEHIPGITYRDNDGQLKLIPPYKSKEYWDLPGNLRERLYTMGGDPIADRKVSNYF